MSSAAILPSDVSLTFCSFEDADVSGGDNCGYRNVSETASAFFSMASGQLYTSTGPQSDHTLVSPTGESV